jgi:hypothetical protein
MEGKMRSVVLVMSLLLWQTFALAQTGPERVFEAYKAALKDGVAGEYLELLTEQSRMMVHPTPGPMQREYSDLRDLTFRVSLEGPNRAVVSFTPASSKVPPYVLRKERGEWKIDLKTMSEEYVFDHDNNWHRKGAARR